MTVEEIKKQAERITTKLKDTKPTDRRDKGDFAGAWTEAAQFVNDFSSEKSTFSNLIKTTDPLNHNPDWVISNTVSAVDALVRYIENGLNRKISPERQAQIDVVSDFLEQAEQLLKDKKIHPAAPAVIIGAALEEFLRNWAEDLNLIADTSKSTIDTYSKLLKQEDLLTKQDMKDITSWAGIRNDAAHGNWEEVNDIKRIKIMLEGVNHFMRKYSPDNY